MDNHIISTSSAIGFHSVSNRYVLLRPLGDGGFGEVWLALPLPKSFREHSSIPSKSLVAIKSIKTKLQNIEKYANFREVQFLSRVSSHCNLIKAYEIFVDNSMFQCHIVMQTMDMNLYELIKSRNGCYFPNMAIKEILYQIVNGLNHIHNHGFFHRDIKPENILISSSNQLHYSLKLADFGLSRHVSCNDPFTTYVSTRWYRAPELIFKCNQYTYCVDIWAFGVVAAEIANLRPLFPGKDEMDLIERQISVLGTPDISLFAGYWDFFYIFMTNSGFNVEPYHGVRPSQLINNYYEDYYELALLISYCIKWNPEMRISAGSILRLPYFHDLFTNPSSYYITNEATAATTSSSSMSTNTGSHSSTTPSHSSTSSSSSAVLKMNGNYSVSTIQPTTRRYSSSTVNESENTNTSSNITSPFDANEKVAIFAQNH